jgi:ankyrin repeat protein
MVYNQEWDTDYEGNTALHRAVNDGNGVCDITTLQLLLANPSISSNINRLNSDGDTALDRCYMAFPHIGMSYLLEANGIRSNKTRSCPVCKTNLK